MDSDFFQREADLAVARHAQGFPILAVTGPRQSGKTTLARKLFADRPYRSFEDLDQLDFVRRDPRGFLAQFPDGAVLDEAQRCPELFSYLQGRVDADGRMGLFVLTGSQQFGLMAGISQSLAGRVALIQLLPFSLREIERSGRVPERYEDLLVRGGYPPVHVRDVAPGVWYDSYIRTYIERDLREIVQVRNLSAFQHFVRLCAAQTGQLLNLSRLGSSCGISHGTASAWLSALEASYIVHRLHPHHRNFKKRLVKSPKLYFHDCGLAAWLLGIESADQLAVHEMRGPLFETWVVSELIKSQFHRGYRSNLYFWRDHNGEEVDVVADRGLRLVPLEIKAGRTLNPNWFKGLDRFTALAGDAVERPWLVYGGVERASGGVCEIVPWRRISEVADALAPDAGSMFSDDGATDETDPRGRSAPRSANGVARPRVIRISGLPAPTEVFLDREDQLRLLDRAWWDPETRTLALVGLGGIGKSALMNRWLSVLAERSWDDAEWIFGWSFSENPSFEAFHQAAAAALGIEPETVDLETSEPETSDGPVALVRRFRARRGVLLLDGLDARQHPPGPHIGRVADDGLRMLVRELAAQFNGLCVLTTRLAPTDLSGGAGYAEIFLTGLEPAAGAELLRRSGARGSAEDLGAAVREMAGHPFALVLLARALNELYGGEVVKRQALPRLDDGVEGADGAREVFRTYAQWLAQEEGEAVPEIRALELLGLLGPSVDAATLAAARAEPPIEGLTEEISESSELRWRRALARLRRLSLVAPERDDGRIEIHPWIGGGFGELAGLARPAVLEALRDRVPRLSSDGSTASRAPAAP